MGGAYRTHGRYGKCIQSFGGNYENKRLLGRLSPRWEGNIGIDLREIGLEVVAWIHLARYRRVSGSCERGDKPSGCVSGGIFVDYILTGLNLLRLLW